MPPQTTYGMLLAFICLVSHTFALQHPPHIRIYWRSVERALNADSKKIVELSHQNTINVQNLGVT